MSWSLVNLWYPGETDRAKELEERNRQLNQRKLERGQVTEEWVTRQQEAFESSGPDAGAWDQQILEAAGQGAVEGLQELPGKVRAGLNAGAGWTLSFIPWWGWLIGAGVLFGYLGGGVYLRGILARK